MSATPSFTATARVDKAAISTANTARDGTGTIADLMTGAATGTRVERVVIQATGTTTAGMVRIFIYVGGAWYLLFEKAVSAIAVSATQIAFRDETAFSNLILPSASYKLGVSTHNAEAFNVVALGGDF